MFPRPQIGPDFGGGCFRSMGGYLCCHGPDHVGPAESIRRIVLTITLKAPDGTTVTADTLEEVQAVIASMPTAPATAPQQAPATAPATGTVRVNTGNGKPAVAVQECTQCYALCLDAAKCICADFDVPGHTRKFKTWETPGFGKNAGRTFRPQMEQHLKNSCYARALDPAQIRGMSQSLIHNGFKVIGVDGVELVKMTGRTSEALGRIVPVPGGPNRTTKDGRPMCRAEFASGKRKGELCPAPVWAEGDPNSGTCKGHQAPTFWAHQGTYAADPTTPPYDQTDLPEVAPQPVGQGNEAKGAQTVDTAGKSAQLSLESMTKEEIIAKLLG